MSHNLTQPEEIDQILMAIARHDMEVDTPISDWGQLGKTAQDAERYELARRASYGHLVS